MTILTPLVQYIITHQETLIQVDFIKELWMIPERMMAQEIVSADQFIITTPSPLYIGKLFVHDKMFFGIKSYTRTDDRHSDTKTYTVLAEPTHITYNSNESTALCTPQDVFILTNNDIISYTGDPVETTIGLYIANYLFLVYPFGNKIPYLNEEFSASKLEKLIALPLLDGSINTKDVKDKYINTLSLFGGSPEIFCPNISEKTITIPQEINDLRVKLVADNKAALEAGDASVMSDIEKQLIKAYKQYLQGDPSLHFLLKPKYFNVTLKKLFLTQGMTEIFGSPGKFTFIEQPMGRGWKQKDLPAIFNEVRSGSFSRAIETANGGVIAKLILRVLQDTRVAEDDCGTTRGEHVHATIDSLHDFLWNYVIESSGENTLISEETIHLFLGKDIVIRTPGYCQAKLGFCAKCFGYLFESLGQKAFAPVANDLAKAQVTNSLKAMHGKSHSVLEINDLNKYLTSA